MMGHCVLHNAGYYAEIYRRDAGTMDDAATWKMQVSSDYNEFILKRISVLENGMLKWF